MIAESSPDTVGDRYGPKAARLPRIVTIVLAISLYSACTLAVAGRYLERTTVIAL